MVESTKGVIEFINDSDNSNIDKIQMKQTASTKDFTYNF